MKHYKLSLFASRPMLEAWLKSYNKLKMSDADRLQLKRFNAKLSEQIHLIIIEKPDG